jgi:tetratricopeptide (TPR) repeat protein
MAQADAAPAPAWLAAIDWNRRSAAFGPLHVHCGSVASIYGPLSGSGHEPTDRLRALWSDFAAHPNFLVPIDDEASPGRLVVEYAPIDWSFVPGPLVGGVVPQRRFASWGVQLCEVFDVVRRAVPDDERGYFADPRPYLDLDDQVRVGFEPANPDAAGVAPELRKRWPHCTDAGLVYLVGVTLSRLVSEQHDSAVTDIIAHCTAIKPRQRYGSLALVRKAFEGALASPHAIRRGDELEAWRSIERGLGWLAMDDAVEACAVLEAGVCSRVYGTLRADVLDEARRRRAIVVGVPAEPAPRRPVPTPAPSAPAWMRAVEAATLVPWETAAAEGAELEARHHDRKALERYVASTAAAPQLAARLTAIARCFLALGDTGPAIDYARRALAHEPSCVEAYSIQYRARLERREPRDALVVVERWLAIAPELGAAHHARGRALLALGRLDDAADSFDRALTLDGTLLGAMLLRREIERTRVGLRSVVGTQLTVAFDLPPRFASVRAALIDGDTARAISLLSEAAYEHDGTAQVLLGNCLAAAERFHDALAVFDRAAGMAPEVVRVALEGTARALEALGRRAEADAVHRRLVHASTTGSELRVRTSR